jgi:hypothetical protein
LFEVQRKWPAEGQDGAFDPKQTKARLKKRRQFDLSKWSELLTLLSVANCVSITNN